MVIGSGNKVLVRLNVFGPRDVVSEVRIGVEVAIFVFELEFAAFAVALRIIKLRQHQGRAELAVVQHVPRHLVIRVQPHIETGKYGLVDAGIEVVRAFRLDRIGDGLVGLISGAGEQRDVGLRRLRLIGRREIPRIAGMESRALERLIDQGGARAGVTHPHHELL